LQRQFCSPVDLTRKILDEIIPILETYGNCLGIVVFFALIVAMLPSPDIALAEEELSEFVF
jgi:hypothetical protein